MTREGQIIAGHGRHYLVEQPDGRRLLCFPRGKKSELVCGDRVVFTSADAGQGVITHCLERRSLLYRSNEFRQKLIAANVDQLVFVVATEPAFSPDLLSRALLAAESQSMRSLILLNKIDLPHSLAMARQQLAIFQHIGYTVLELSARQGVADLRAHLAGHTSVLVGQSGMGKSTLINALIPDAGAATREISTALDSGKHTTTHTCLYHMDGSSHLIDSPGLQEFGLAQLSRNELESCFIEFRPYLGQCRFRDCRHDREPGCALQAASQAGAISPERLACFTRLSPSPSR